MSVAFCLLAVGCMLWKVGYWLFAVWNLLSLNTNNNFDSFIIFPTGNNMFVGIRDKDEFGELLCWDHFVLATSGYVFWVDSSGN